MDTRLSSKGQVVIPKRVREELGLEPGARFHVRVAEGSIVLEPVTESLIAELYGEFAGVDLLTALEREHARECLERK
jgi:AbrB family looped-hinge helix DNA binding protein